MKIFILYREEQELLLVKYLFTPDVFEEKKNENGIINLITGSIKKTEMIDKKFQ